MPVTNQPIWDVPKLYAAGLVPERSVPPTFTQPVQAAPVLMLIVNGAAGAGREDADLVTGR